MKTALVVLLSLVIGAAAGMLLPRIFPVLRMEPEIDERTDTLYLKDTNIYRFPDMVSEITIPEETIVIDDSLIIISDSVGVLPEQQKHYREDDYEAWVSGYKPRLDSIYVFPETRYITNEIQVKRKPTKWGIGIQAGYGVALPNGKPQMAPYIGIGISYNLIRF